MTYMLYKHILLVCITSLLMGALLFQPAHCKPIDTLGTGALCAKQYQAAIDKIISDTALVDTSYRLFKLGIANFYLQNFDKAQFYFLLSAQKSPLLAPFCYEYLGDIELMNDKPGNALATWRAASELPVPVAYKNNVRNKMYSIIKDNPELAELGTWSGLKGISPDIRFKLFVVDSMRSYIGQKKWKSVDTLLVHALAKADDNLAAELFDNLSLLRVPDSVLTTKCLFDMAQKAYDIDRYNDALSDLEKCSWRRDFSRVLPLNDYLMLRCKASFSAKDYAAVVVYGRQYKKKCGSNPEILYLTGRSYRRLGDQKQSAIWYELYLKTYPNGTRSGEILWLRGTDLEDQNNFREAITHYRKLYRMFSSVANADDAFFRSGLCQYKLQDYAQAQAVFSQFIKQMNTSSFVTAAYYWNACASIMQKDTAEALRSLNNAVERDPVDYYSFRARQLLDSLHSPVSAPAPDTTASIAATRTWLDSITKPEKKALAPFDSMLFMSGSMLALAGVPDRAELYLRTLESNYPAHLVLQFDIAQLYSISNDFLHASRAGQRFSWRIPPENRSIIPAPLFKLMYPVLFNGTVLTEAKRNNINPALVFGIIKQESIFDPQAKSAAGAIGLMQIMPATGATLAKQLNVPFASDSLFNPAINIAFGTYYIKQLLDQWNGNIINAVASYNGGPQNVKRWYNAGSSKPLDMYVEDIGFAETRGYVKKVLANYWTYCDLLHCTE